MSLISALKKELEDLSGGQYGLYSEFPNSQGYKEKPCLEKNKNEKEGERGNKRTQIQVICCTVDDLLNSKYERLNYDQKFKKTKLFKIRFI